MAHDSEGAVKAHRNGSRRELIVCIDLLNNGFDVFKNVSGFGCDLVAWKFNRYYGVEVKSGQHRMGRQYRTKNYPILPAIQPNQLERCDVVALVNPEGEVQYFAKPKTEFATAYGYGSVSGLPYDSPYDLKEKVKILWYGYRKSRSSPLLTTNPPTSPSVQNPS